MSAEEPGLPSPTYRVERLGDTSLGPQYPAIGVRFPVLGQPGARSSRGRPLGPGLQLI